MVYIYGLVCPVAGVVRYVGKSIAPERRRAAHINAAMRGDYNHRTARWIRKIAAVGLEPALIILHEVVAGERWQDIERAFIASAEDRGWKLTNSTAGGEGLDFIDPQAAAEYRAKMSAAMSDLWNRPERRAQASERAKRIHADPEIVAARKVSLRRALAQPETKERLRKSATEINARPEVRALKSAASKAMWADPAERLRIERAFTPEVRAQMSALAKARWSDPIRGAKARAENGSPERRAKIAEGARRRATPEYRAMMAEKTRASWEKRRLKTQDG